MNYPKTIAISEPSPIERRLLSARLEYLGYPEPSFITLDPNALEVERLRLGAGDVLMVAIHPFQCRRQLAVRKLRLQCESVGRGRPRLVGMSIPLVPTQVTDLQEQEYDALLFKPYSLEALRAVLQGLHGPLDHPFGGYSRPWAA